MKDLRRSRWPFSPTIADTICEALASGARITQLPSGFPSYNVICRWRRENPDFNEMILLAYADRKEFLLSSIMPLLSSGNMEAVGYSLRETKREIGLRYPPKLKDKKDKRRERSVINTGIGRIEMVGGRIKSRVAI